MAQRVVGVDGTKAGWVAVALVDGVFADARGYETLAELLTAEPDARAIGVDMPSALPKGGGRRLAELEARRLLGPRWQSVFLSGPLEVLESRDHRDAIALCRGRGWPAPSAQAFALRGKIHQALAAAKDPRVIEVHPELCFWALAHDTPLSHSKWSWNGHHERLRLLADAGIIIPSALSGGAAEVAADDVLDAASAAWTASRRAKGLACRVPASEEQPDGGFIWY